MSGLARDEHRKTPIDRAFERIYGRAVRAAVRARRHGRGRKPRLRPGAARRRPRAVRRRGARGWRRPRRSTRRRLAAPRRPWRPRGATSTTSWTPPSASTVGRPATPTRCPRPPPRWTWPSTRPRPTHAARSLVG